MNIFRAERYHVTFVDSCLAFFPFLIVFILIPTALFLGNIQEFKSDYWSLFFLYFLAGRAFLFLFFILHGLPLRIADNISRLLFWTGIFMLVSDICFPLQWGIKNGIHIVFEPLWQIICQFVLAGIVVWCAYRFSLLAVKKIIAPFIFILLIVNIATFAVSWFIKIKKFHNIYPSQSQSVRINSGQSGVANVFHVIFDAYSSDEFSKLLDNKDTLEKLRGFTFYKNAFSNYLATDYSFPSFLTGSFYKGGKLSKWIASASSEGIFEEVTKAGWGLRQYVPDRNYQWCYKRASNTIFGADLLNMDFIRLRTFRLLKFCAIRVAPVILRKETWNISDRILGHLFFLFKLNIAVEHGLSELKKGELNDFFYQVPMCRHFIEQEREQEERGRYVFAHFIFPHDPYAWDSECNFVDKSSHSEQCRCAAKFIFEFIEVLKDTGRFDSSLIIIHGDHGEPNDFASELPEFVLSDEIITKFKSARVGMSSMRYLTGSRPLLLIKPPFSSRKQLVVSDVLVQLVDLPPTVYHLLGIDRKTEEGESLFRLRNASEREIHTFVINLNKSKKAVHLSFSLDNGWCLYPDIALR